MFSILSKLRLSREHRCTSGECFLLWATGNRFGDFLAADVEMATRDADEGYFELWGWNQLIVFLG